MPAAPPPSCYTRLGLWTIIISQEQEISRLRKTIGNMKGVFTQHKLDPYAVPGVREVDEAEALDQAEESADPATDDAGRIRTGDVRRGDRPCGRVDPG